MSGGLQKKLGAYKKVNIPTRKSISKPSTSSKSKTSINNVAYVSSVLGDYATDEEYENMDKNLQYELVMAKLNGYDVSNVKSIWDDPLLEQYNKEEIREIQETLFKSELIESGIYTCKRCGCDRSIVQSLQQKSLDEGETIYVTCVQCRNKYKMNG